MSFYKTLKRLICCGVVDPWRAIGFERVTWVLTNLCLRSLDYHPLPLTIPAYYEVIAVTLKQTWGPPAHSKAQHAETPQLIDDWSYIGWFGKFFRVLIQIKPNQLDRSRDTPWAFGDEFNWKRAISQSIGKTPKLDNPASQRMAVVLILVVYISLEETEYDFWVRTTTCRRNLWR